MDENKKNEMTENEDMHAAAEEHTAEPVGSAAMAEEITRETEEPREQESGSENKKPDEPEKETEDVSGIPEEDSEGDTDADSEDDGKSASEESGAEDEAEESEDDEPESEPEPEPEEEETEPPSTDDLEPGEFDLEEGLLHGEELQRNSPAASRMPVRYYIIAGLVFVALFLIALLVIFAVKGTLAPQIGRVEAFIKRRSTDEFSAHITGASVRDTGVYKNDILLLTDTALLSFSSSAKENVLQAVSCDEPSIAVKKKCILLFDRSGTSVNLIRGSKVVHSFSAPKSILDADTGSNGRFCIAMRDEEYKCSVMVFDPSAYANSGQAQGVEGTTKAKDVNLTYWFSDGYVTDVTCDEECRYIGVSLVRADDAIVNSEFYLVDTKNSDVSSYPVLKFPGEAIAGTTILRDGSFFIVTDSAAYRTIDGELEKVVDYDDDLEIEFTSLSYATSPVILLSSFGLRDSGILMIFDKNGGLKSTVKVEGRAIGLDSSKNGAAVMITDRVLTYTADGLLVGETKLNAACEHIVFKGSFIYLQFGGEMKKFPAFSRPGEG